MKDYSRQHKQAWEFDAYDFWVRTSGAPEERAKKDVENPKAMLRRYADYFDRFEGVRVANICGSCGKKAIPLALLGADVTIFDISEANKRYALEVARAARAPLTFEVCDILEIDLSKYAGSFDVSPGGRLLPPEGSQPNSAEGIAVSIGEAGTVRFGVDEIPIGLRIIIR